MAYRHAFFANEEYISHFHHDERGEVGKEAPDAGDSGPKVGVFPAGLICKETEKSLIDRFFNCYLLTFLLTK